MAFVWPKGYRLFDEDHNVLDKDFKVALILLHEFGVAFDLDRIIGDEVLREIDAKNRQGALRRCIAPDVGVAIFHELVRAQVGWVAHDFDSKFPVASSKILKELSVPFKVSVKRNRSGN